MNTDPLKQALIYGLALIASVSPQAVLSVELTIPPYPESVYGIPPPSVMLAMSRDHQLAGKAYTDYDDLNNDGIIDYSYTDSINYTGYFDSNKCYTYASNVFTPQKLVDTVTVPPATLQHQCSGDDNWSGNFLNWATMTRMDVIRKVLYGGHRSTDNGLRRGNPTNTELERAMIPYDGHAFVKVYSSNATDMQNYTPYNEASISMCNLTQGVGLSKDLDTPTYPPLLRVASGSWPRWAASPGYQCQWGDGTSATQPIQANNLVRPNTTNGLIVRLKVCITGLEEANCSSYYHHIANAAERNRKKPDGLLQRFWRYNAAEFGLFSGSWEPQHTRKGGVSRTTVEASQNIDYGSGLILDEGAMPGIINALEHFRINGYNFTTHAYVNETDWGNPISEIYLETLRYLGGKPAPTSSFAGDDSNYTPRQIPPVTPQRSHTEGLPLIRWDEGGGFIDEAWCRQRSVVVLSAGSNSYDTDDLAGNDLAPNGTAVNAVSETSRLEETLSGSYLVGSSTGGTGTGSDNDQQCTAKNLSNLSTALGICPEAPHLQGGYQMAGLAHYARTTDFYPVATEHEVNSILYNKGNQSITTYSVDMAEAIRFKIPVDGGTITLMPTCQANTDANAIASSSGWTPCSLIDVKIEDGIQLDSGSFLAIWEDASAGGDYDMDGIGRLTFCVGPTACHDNSVLASQLKVTASVVQTDTPKAMQLGYTLVGSDGDGIHLPALCPGGTPCSSVDTGLLYRKSASDSPQLLKSPLWYAAKYGGFDTTRESVALADQTPQNQSWDADNNGVPDAYFNASSINSLESILDNILNKQIPLEIASSASIAATSTRVDSSAALYQAKFKPRVWVGQLLAYRIDTTTGKIGDYAWDAGDILTSQMERAIFSYNDANNTGINFNYANLSDAQKALLTENELNYIKGGRTQEQPSGTLRTRLSLLGDIVNSDPQFIGTLSQGYDSLPGNEGKDYLKYITSPALRNRPPMLAVGANDGMLHVFNAKMDGTDGGKELFAYVPSTLIRTMASAVPTDILFGGPATNLFKYFGYPTYEHRYFVDGAPSVGDAYFDVDGGKKWRTVLVGTLGAGGKGVFALDVTLLSPADYKSAETFSASRVLWEVNNQRAKDSGDQADFQAHLGVTMGQASIVRMANGQFAAVFGNGHNSANQTAVLYIVDIATGKIIRSFDTGVGGPDDQSTLNGMATPLTVDANGDHIVDAIYAGDFQGNMWKFDVSATDPGSWKIAFTASGSPAPLFKALSSSYHITKNFLGVDLGAAVDTPIQGQIITAKPEFTQHPQGGIMLYFGTGKNFGIVASFNIVRSGSSVVDSFYGIWDNCVNYAGATPRTCDTPIGDKDAALVKQTITYEDSNSRVTSQQAVDYASKKGWYMDLYQCSGVGGDGQQRCTNSISGEGVVSQPMILDRRIIFSTQFPVVEYCSSGGGSWLMVIDALTGKRLDVTAFLSDGDVSGHEKTPMEITVNAATTSISGVKPTVGQISRVTKIDSDSPNQELAVSGSGKGDGDDDERHLQQFTLSKPQGQRQAWSQLR